MLTNYDAKSIAETMGLGILPGLETDTPDGQLAIERAVERGLPPGALNAVTEWLAVPDADRAGTRPLPDLVAEARKRSDAPLTLPESEWTERIARLIVHARRALGTDDEARDFLLAPHPELGGRSPVEAARTDLGARRAEQLLNALEYGLAL